MTKMTMVAMVVLTCCIATSSTLGGGCKPDVSTRDPITKEEANIWRQELSSSGIMKGLWSGENMAFTADIARTGNKNFIIVSLRKAESSDRRAVFEGQYRAIAGNRIIFGFENGDPVSLLVTEGSNGRGVDGMTGDVIMSFTWNAEVSDKEMAGLRGSLTTRQINALRIELASGLVDKPVTEKNGKKLKEKFSCFYQYLDTMGTTLLAGGASPNQPDSVQGTKASEPTATQPGSYEEWTYAKVRTENPIGKEIRVTQNWTGARPMPGLVPKDYLGAWLVGGSYSPSPGPASPNLKPCLLIIPNALADEASKYPSNYVITVEGECQREPNPGTVNILVHRFVGGTPPPAPTSATSTAQLPTDQIIDMLAAKIPEDVVIKKIRESGSTYDADALIKVKKAGASDEVIRAMTK